MLSPFNIHAASQLSPAGFANDRLGWQLWPGPAADALARQGLEALHWDWLFQSEAARFARMDWFCRLGLMTVEWLGFDFTALPASTRARIGVCVETAAGSLATDLSYLETPRPSLFAYTLPSTVIGEICIRHGFKGPVLCLMVPAVTGNAALAVGRQWLLNGDADFCVVLAGDALKSDPTVALAPYHSQDWNARAWLLGPVLGTPREQPLAPETLAALQTRLAPNLA